MNHEQAIAYVNRFKLPAGQTCRACSNYESWCRDVYRGEKPYDGDSTTCAVGDAKDNFNVDFRKPSEFVKARRKTR